jgi:hypothetical protein
MSVKDTFKTGKSVRFKDGQIDEDSGIDISGWQGRISKVDDKHKMLLVALDSITLKSMSRDYLEECEEEGLDWSEYYIGFDDVEPAEPRDTLTAVKKTITKLSNLVGWAVLGEEGREISAILNGASGEQAQLRAWNRYLRKTLKFPFKAEISEWQRPGSVLQAGQKVQVIRIEKVDEWYGIIVRVKKGRDFYTFPLCDLEAVPANAPNHDAVQLYAVWFANK